MIKNLLKRSFELAGLDIRRKRKLPPERKPPYPFVHFVVDVVFDVGANEGQYALELRQTGYRHRIVSFEPLPDAHAVLQEQSKQDPLWTIHQRAAIGAREGKSVINISGNKLNSSILPMLSSHSDAAPESAYVGKADVDVITLDSVFARYVPESETPALKIDAQGFEHEVLDGVSAYLDRFACVFVELPPCRSTKIKRPTSGSLAFSRLMDFIYGGLSLDLRTLSPGKRCNSMPAL
jgi:FkbM family methyltransferase